MAAFYRCFFSHPERGTSGGIFKLKPTKYPVILRSPSDVENLQKATEKCKFGQKYHLIESLCKHNRSHIQENDRFFLQEHARFYPVKKREQTLFNNVGNYLVSLLKIPY